jgi:hypothetical protein
MDKQRLEHLLDEYGRRLPPERLLTDDAAAQRFWDRTVRVPEADPVRRFPRLALPRTAWPGLLVISAVAAVLLIAVLVFFQPAAGINLRADGAYSPDMLFVKGSAGEPGPRYHIGVRVDKPAYVRIVALSSRGEVRSLPLGPDGQNETQVGAQSSTAFGSFALRDPLSSVEQFVVLASATPIPEEQFTDWTKAMTRRLTAAARVDAEPVARDFTRRFGGVAAVIVPPSA